MTGKSLMQPTEPSPNGSRPSRVAILLCTMQGHRYLGDQLDSITRQTLPTWSIWVSDDGSDHRTHDILAAYRQKLTLGQLSVRTGPGRGFVANFLSLACRHDISADHYAFADQDDIWENDKLARALVWLRSVPSDVPALYCSRTLKVNEQNQVLGLSDLHLRSPSFANALVQNIASGNTMVFNHAACELLRKVGPNLQVAAHDWWLYLLVTGCGGRVFFDPQPTLRYRHHGGNLIGTNRHWRARVTHARTLLNGQFRTWNQINIDALRTMATYLTEENVHRLEEFSKARQGGLFVRWGALQRSGVYRQSRLGNLGLIAAVILKKL